MPSDSHVFGATTYTQTPADQHHDDRALVLAAQRDPTAFTPLYERYVQQVYRYCFVRFGDRERAEDATSNIFLKAFANLKQMRNGMFAAWLFRIAHNVVVDGHRKHRATAPLEAAALVPDNNPSPERHVADQLDSAALRAAFTQLPDEQRTVMELQLADWSTKQIADALGKSTDAIKMLRYRALQHLRDVLHSTIDVHGRND